MKLSEGWYCTPAKPAGFQYPAEPFNHALAIMAKAEISFQFIRKNYKTFINSVKMSLKSHLNNKNDWRYELGGNSYEFFKKNFWVTNILSMIKHSCACLG